MAIPKPPHSIKALQQRIWDAELEIHRSSNVLTDGQALHIAGTAQEIDTGGGFQEGYLVVDLTTITKQIAGAWYRVTLQGALDSSFASNTELAQIALGDAGLPNDWMTEDHGTGVYITPYCNLYGDTIMRYLRGVLQCGGTPGTGITFSAFLTKLSG